MRTSNYAGVTSPTDVSVRQNLAGLRALSNHTLSEYANAQLIHRRLHASWRKLRRLHGDDDKRVKGALTKATAAALVLHNAKREHQQAVRALRLAEKRGRRARQAVPA